MENPKLLVELCGGPMDGSSLPIAAYAKAIAIPYTGGGPYQELAYKQDPSNPQRFNYAPEDS
jgi:hypothetical protein